MTDGQTTLMREIDEAVQKIQKLSSPHTRRLAIDERLSKPQGGPTLMDAMGEAAMHDMAAVAAGGPMPSEPDPEDPAAGAFHAMHEAGIAKGLTGMVVVPFKTFLDKGTIPRRSQHNQTHSHVAVSELTEKVRAEGRWFHGACVHPYHPHTHSGQDHLLQPAVAHPKPKRDLQPRRQAGHQVRGR